ncbi:hypothetical protein EIP91_005955 [Steccherinum ochraceum]|uniref:AB hydrolase-1 domain-containing protein n=1 Tax=Steccherinum ochraceum TaxID=92696 RepID=A0A4R0RZD8_9APHY|nr:hypothetical protein EIP91_005955 [Steccherinum ochraceum]
MDPANYKDLKVSRGYNYHYYAVKRETDKPTILFVHGFPSTARDWRYMVPHFESRGYGIIAPDILGYGGTDKPTDWREYQGSTLARDIHDILVAEGVKKAIAVGHDWGAFIVSRLANFQPEDFLGYAFFNVSYVTPNPQYDNEKFHAQWKKITGHDNYGYWYFFAEDDADKVIMDHLDAFISAGFSKENNLSADVFSAKGALKRSLLNEYRAEVAPFMTGEDRKIWTETFLKGGFKAPLSFYRIMCNNGRNSDDATIPKERLFPPASAPLFYVAALRDSVCDPKGGKASFTQEGLKSHNVSIVEVDGDHWWPMYTEKANEVAQKLETWIVDVVKV